MEINEQDRFRLLQQLGQLCLALKLCKDLLDPEMYGHAVTLEVRNRAREVFGIDEREF